MNAMSTGGARIILGGSFSNSQPFYFLIFNFLFRKKKAYKIIILMLGPVKYKAYDSSHDRFFLLYYITLLYDL
jgi:hypothetical protein